MASVTPGFTYTSTTAITAANLNLLGQPSVSISAGEVVPSSMSPSGIGYSTGAGGTQTQATSKATAFTLSTACGQITTAGDILNAATIVSATWTNTLIAATDTVVINHKSGGTLGAYSINVACLAGSATLSIRNNTASNLTETLVLNFTLIKGVTA